MTNVGVMILVMKPKYYYPMLTGIYFVKGQRTSIIVTRTLPPPGLLGGWGEEKGTWGLVTPFPSSNSTSKEQLKWEILQETIR